MHVAHLDAHISRSQSACPGNTCIMFLCIGHILIKMKVYTHVQFGRFYNIDIKEEQVKKERKFKRNILGEKNDYN
jgi:hypothetical protein